MKCFKCKFFWYMFPCNDSPYGETACMKKEVDLFDAQPEDVADCNDFETIETSGPQAIGTTASPSVAAAETGLGGEQNNE